MQTQTLLFFLCVIQKYVISPSNTVCVLSPRISCIGCLSYEVSVSRKRSDWNCSVQIDAEITAACLSEKVHKYKLLQTSQRFIDAVDCIRQNCFRSVDSQAMQARAFCSCVWTPLPLTTAVLHLCMKDPHKRTWGSLVCVSLKNLITHLLFRLSHP